MDQPENKATATAASEDAPKPVQKAQAKPKPATPKPAAKPVDLGAQARADELLESPNAHLEEPVSPKVDFNDAAFVVLNPIGGGAATRTEIRKAPDGRSFAVIPPGFTAELRTDVVLKSIDFDWKIVPPTLEGALPVGVDTVEDVVFVEARSIGTNNCTVFEGDVLVELS